ncbi:MAG: DUF2520 domain-containing protein [Solirubrobacteraceae bacterium]|nr:DUF2520 domain-containing protein [Solirubrobacteraceae bacterium]
MDTRPGAPEGAHPNRFCVIGNGRMGASLVRAMRHTGLTVTGPHGRGHDGAGADVVLLCVPDAEIADAAAVVTPGPIVGHCSGARTLAPLAPHEALSLHPLMTVPHGEVDLAGAPCAVAGSTDRALAVAADLATRLRMRTVTVADEDRAAYHAAASIAANYLLAVEDLAVRLAGTAGVDRTLLAPLVRAAVDAWQADGAPAALTGPVARGDDATVARQRAAVAERLDGDDLALFDALTTATARLADRARGPVADHAGTASAGGARA